MTADSARQSAPTTRFRQRGASWTGWFLVVVFGGLALVLAVTDFELSTTAFLVAFAVGFWLLLARPSVALSQHGVTLSNLLRRVHFTWPAIDLMETRWNLTLVSHDGQEHTAWAISAKRPKPVDGRPNPGAVSAVAPNPAPSGDKAQFTHREGSAGAVARAIESAHDGYKLATKRGDLDQQDARVTRAVEPVAAVGWALVVVFLLVGWFSL